MRRNVKVRLKLTLEMIRAQRHHACQLVERNRTHIIVVQIVTRLLKAVRAFLHHWRMASQRRKGVDQIQQQPFLRQRIVRMPQAINQLADVVSVSDRAASRR